MSVNSEKFKFLKIISILIEPKTKHQESQEKDNNFH